ncbi:hypothetical protein IV67_GL000758 [Weissella minor]|uniref:Uncharacterized protein n=2 Tax=Weissella minor TaxID=1620 RepID=A0A0R2JGM7_9LACO|nr:hypothetical protein IV67_GL000758 [Weissella minor]
MKSMKLKQPAAVMRVQYIGSNNSLDATNTELVEPVVRRVFARPNTSSDELHNLGRIFEQLGQERYVHQIVTTKQYLVK